MKRKGRPRSVVTLERELRGLGPDGPLTMAPGTRVAPIGFGPDRRVYVRLKGECVRVRRRKLLDSCDAFGHAVDDMVRRAMGDTIRRGGRTSPLFFGKEFATSWDDPPAR